MDFLPTCLQNLLHSTRYIPSLIKAPEDVIDYIVLHELCHLKIKEYSCHYWDLLYKFMPNYHEKIEWLRVSGGSLLQLFHLESKKSLQCKHFTLGKLIRDIEHIYYYITSIFGTSIILPYFDSINCARLRAGLFLRLIEEAVVQPYNIISKLPRIINFSFDREIATLRSCNVPAAPTFLSGLFLTNEKMTISACVPNAPVVVVTLVLLTPIL